MEYKRAQSLLPVDFIRPAIESDTIPLHAASSGINSGSPDVTASQCAEDCQPLPKKTRAGRTPPESKQPSTAKDCSPLPKKSRAGRTPTESNQPLPKKKTSRKDYNCIKAAIDSQGLSASSQNNTSQKDYNSAKTISLNFVRPIDWFLDLILSFFMAVFCSCSLVFE